MALKGQQLIQSVIPHQKKLSHYNDLKPGDTVVVSIKVKEGDKERLQSFKGVIIRLQGRGVTRSFTVRKMAAGNIGVERTFPFSSPSLDSIKRVSTGRVRRAKLYYLRNLSGKKARLQNEFVTTADEQSMNTSEVQDSHLVDVSGEKSKK